MILGVSSQKMSTTSARTIDPRRLTTFGMLFAGISGDQVGDQARGGNFGDGDSQEDNSEQAVGIGDNPFDCFSLSVSRLRLIFEPQTVQGHESGLGSGEETPRGPERKREERDKATVVTI